MTVNFQADVEKHLGFLKSLQVIRDIEGAYHWNITNKKIIILAL